MYRQLSSIQLRIIFGTNITGERACSCAVLFYVVCYNKNMLVFVRSLPWDETSKGIINTNSVIIFFF